MDIELSRACNRMSARLLARFLDADPDLMDEYVRELEDDRPFLDALNERIRTASSHYSKGLFGRGKLDSVHWFGNQRVALYVLLRWLQPELSVETGVFYGGTTAFILRALEKNGRGRLVSIDLPGQEAEDAGTPRHGKVGSTEIVPEQLSTGFLVPPELRGRWELILGDSRERLGRIEGPVDFFSHDSEHSHDFMFDELTRARTFMSGRGVMFADDIHWSNGFAAFCVANHLHPLYLTDNGKDDISVRLGLVKLDHPNNREPDVTGSIHDA